MFHLLPSHTESRAAHCRFRCWRNAKHLFRTSRSTILASAAGVVDVAPCLLSFLSFHSERLLFGDCIILKKVSNRPRFVSIARSNRSDHLVVNLPYIKQDIRSDQTS